MASQSTSSHPAAVAVTPSTSSLEGDRGGSDGCASSTGSCHATQPHPSKTGDAQAMPPQPEPGVAERPQPYINTTYRRASSLDLLVHTLESAVERAIAPPSQHHPPIPRDAASSTAPPPAPPAPPHAQKSAPSPAAASTPPQAAPPLPPPPRRPMTAYTLFFLLEREYVIQTLPIPSADASPTLHEGKVRLPDVPARYRDILLPPDWCAGPGKRKKRRHRRAHGKIGFHELSKVVAGRWARLDEVDKETKEYVKKIAKRQLDVYHAEMKEYRKRTKGLGVGTTKAAGGGAKGGGKKQSSKGGGTAV